MANSSGQTYGRNVFVLDISGSMSGRYCETLQLSATRIIEDIPEMSYVGVVLFNSKVEIAHTLIQITDQSVRDRLIRSVPAKAGGGTRIAQGVLAGVKLLEDAGVSPEGATLFLVTDGCDDTGDAYVNQILPTLLTKKIKVVCIAIGRSADRNLDRIAEETNGKTYFASGESRELMARVIESTIQEVRPSNELMEAVFIWVSNDILYLSQSLTTKKVTIDSDIGRNTVFTVGSENYDQISIEIQSPNGRKYDSTSPELIRNPTQKRFQLKLKTTEPGVWSINMTKSSTQPISANISVKSEPFKPSNVVELSVTLKEANKESPPIIIAELRRGKTALIGAEVTATVDKPDGTQSKLVLKHFNEIYCNYFTDYCGSGRYNVTVLAQLLNKSDSVPQLERQLIAGCFKVTDCMPQRPESDVKLEELSLTAAFKQLSNTQTASTSSTSAPKPLPRRGDPKKNEMKLARENIYLLLIGLKKAINSPKITETDRNQMKTTMDTIDTKLSSSDTSLKMEDLNNFMKQLEEFKQKLN